MRIQFIFTFIILTLLAISPANAGQCAGFFFQPKRFLGVRHQTIDQRYALRNLMNLSRELPRSTKDFIGPHLSPITLLRELSMLLKTDNYSSTIAELQSREPDFYLELLRRAQFISALRSKKTLFGESLNPMEAKILSLLFAKQLLQLKIPSNSQPEFEFADSKFAVLVIRRMTQEALAMDLYLDSLQTSPSLQEELHAVKRIAQDFQNRVGTLEALLKHKKASRLGLYGAYTYSMHSSLSPGSYYQFHLGGARNMAPLSALESEIRALELMLNELSVI